MPTCRAGGALSASAVLAFMESDLNRRTVFLGAAASVAATAAAVTGASLWTNTQAGDWREEAQRLRRPPPPGLAGAEARIALIRSATLAATSHNAQAWRFAADDSGITLLPDFTRRTPAVDPDDHHLFVSLGAAAENMVQAAPGVGLVAVPSFDPAGDGRIRVALRPGKAPLTDLGTAIPRRQCTRGIYDGRTVPAGDLAALLAAGNRPGVSVFPIMARTAMASLTALILEANSRQLNDPAFRTELKRWVRFSYGQALETADGLFAPLTGNPEVPELVGEMLFDLLLTADAENAKLKAQVDSSAGLAVFVSDQDDPAHWVAVGGAYQRFALQATALGIKHAFLNQAVEVPEVRRQVAEHLGLGDRRPDLIVRFGYGTPMPWSLRRPVADVLA